MYYTGWDNYTVQKTESSSQSWEYFTSECALAKAIREESKKLPEFRQTVFYISCRCRKCSPRC